MNTKKINGLVSALVPEIRAELLKLDSITRQGYILEIFVMLVAHVPDDRELIQALLKASITDFLLTEEDNSKARFLELVERAFAAADLPEGR